MTVTPEDWLNIGGLATAAAYHGYDVGQVVKDYCKDRGISWKDEVEAMFISARGVLHDLPPPLGDAS